VEVVLGKRGVIILTYFRHGVVTNSTGPAAVRLRPNGEFASAAFYLNGRVYRSKNDAAPHRPPGAPFAIGHFSGAAWASTALNVLLNTRATRNYLVDVLNKSLVSGVETMALLDEPYMITDRRSVAEYQHLLMQAVHKIVCARPEDRKKFDTVSLELVTAALQEAAQSYGNSPVSLLTTFFTAAGLSWCYIAGDGFMEYDIPPDVYIHDFDWLYEVEETQEDEEDSHLPVLRSVHGAEYKLQFAICRSVDACVACLQPGPEGLLYDSQGNSVSVDWLDRVKLAQVLTDPSGWQGSPHSVWEMTDEFYVIAVYLRKDMDARFGHGALADCYHSGAPLSAEVRHRASRGAVHPDLVTEGQRFMTLPPAYI